MTRNILLVEDDPVLGPLTAESLRILGHVVTLATDIDAAFGRCIEKDGFNVILLDLQVGNERGERLIERLRERRASLPPVILFSAQPLAELQRSLRATHAAGALQKPCSIAQIDAAIDDAVASANR